MQGPVSFSGIGSRAENTLSVMQFRRIPGGKVCVEQYTLLSATTRTVYDIANQQS